MSGTESARLALPLLQPGQAQKETFHNEALALLDMAVQPVVVAVGVDTPPVGPAAGQCWIVGTAPTGAWAAHAGAIAGWTAGGWRFVAAIDGAAAWSLAEAMPARHDGGEWRIGDIAGARLTIDGVQVVGAQAAAIPEPTGGATIDAEARGAIEALLAALRDHGLIANS